MVPFVIDRCFVVYAMEYREACANPGAGTQEGLRRRSRARGFTPRGGALRPALMRSSQAPPVRRRRPSRSECGTKHPPRGRTQVADSRNLDGPRRGVRFGTPKHGRDIEAIRAQEFPTDSDK